MSAKKIDLDGWSFLRFTVREDPDQGPRLYFDAVLIGHRDTVRQELRLSQAREIYAALGRAILHVERGHR